MAQLAGPRVLLLMVAAAQSRAEATIGAPAAGQRARVTANFSALHGAIQAGGDLGKLNATIAAAEQHCTALDECVGFTFACAAPGSVCNMTSVDETYSVYFKSVSATNSDLAWWTWLKLPSAVSLSVDAATARPANKLIMGCHSDSGYAHQPRSFYSQMVVGGSFEAERLLSDDQDATSQQWTRADDSHGAPQPIYWNNFTSPGGVGEATLDSSVAFHGATSMKIESHGPAGTSVGVTNRGLGNEGLVFEAGKEYEGYIFVKSDTATTLRVALRNYVSADTLAAARLSHPGGGNWQRLNFSIVPNASTSCREMRPTDTSVHCVPPKPGTPDKPADSRDHICLLCGGEVMIGLDAPTSLRAAVAVVHVDFVFVQPGVWGRFHGLPVLASTVAALQKIGVRAIRQGGSFTDPSYYFWKRWRGPAWARPSMSATWGSSYEGGWGPFEMLDLCEAAGIEPIITTTAQSTASHASSGSRALPACCAPEDMADLLEYCWGNSSTIWGQQRIKDGHAAPYKLRYIELGNEQYNSLFIDQVKAMEARAAAIGKPSFFNYIFPSNLGLNATDIARANDAGLDASRLLADLHVGYGGAVEQAQAEFSSHADFAEGAVNLETNAATHTMKRALAEASDINDFLNADSSRIKIRTASFCTARSGYFDGFDQGLIFFSPSQTWLQPPAWTHAMVADSWQDSVLNVSFGRALGQSAAAQLASDSRTLVVRYVNAYNTSVRVSVDLHNWGKQQERSPRVTQLRPPSDAASVCGPACAPSYYDPALPPLQECCSNPPGNTELIRPLEAKMDDSRSFTAPAFSYTVITYER